MGEMDLTTLAQYGVAGVAIAAIVALIVITKALIKLVGNHIEHNTEAVSDLREVIKELSTLIRERIK
jgi:hypothetical protein